LAAGLPYRNFGWRHRLITWFMNRDIKGFRFFAERLPHWLLPNPKTQGQMKLRTLHGFDLLIDPSQDTGVEYALYCRGTYEEGILDYIGKNYTGQGAFIDVGANIGLMSLYVATHFPDASVHAFEAHPLTMDIFKENLALNHATQVTPYAFALGSQEGSGMIYTDHGQNRGGASLVGSDTLSEGFEISLHRLDDLQLNPVEIIKLDVEGYELEVFKGAEKTLRRDRPTLIVEVSAGRVHERALSHEIYDFIQALGAYKIYKLKGGKERRSSLVEVRSYQELPAHDNLICVAEK
jgi:FkbM family methyltransferase